MRIQVFFNIITAFVNAQLIGYWSGTNWLNWLSSISKFKEPSPWTKIFDRRWTQVRYATEEWLKEQNSQNFCILQASRKLPDRYKLCIDKGSDYVEKKQLYPFSSLFLNRLDSKHFDPLVIFIIYTCIIIVIARQSICPCHPRPAVNTLIKWLQNWQTAWAKRRSAMTGLIGLLPQIYSFPMLSML